MKPYPHKLKVTSLPLPKGLIEVRIDSEVGKYETHREYYSDEETFLEFWKPLVDFYEGVKNDQNRSRSATEKL